MPVDLNRRISGPRPRAGIYTRVSKDKREGRSVAEQETECRRDVERESWDLVGVYSDNNVSASRYSTKERPDWLRFMKALRAGQIDIIVFWEMSRGTRHRREWAELAEVAEDRGLFICVRGRIYDATDPHDMAYLDNLVSRGVEESGETRDRIMRTVKSTAEKGRPHAQPPFGLRSEYDPETGALIAWVPDEFPWGPEDEAETPASLVRQAAKDVLAGVKPHTVVAGWNRRRIPGPKGGQWSAESLVQLLRRPSLMGKRAYHGAIIQEGGWAGLISPADFWALQKILTPKDAAQVRAGGRSRDADAVHLCSGIAKCGVCGARMGFGMNGGVASYQCKGLYAGAPQGCTSRATHTLEEHVRLLVIAEFSMPDVLARFQPKAPCEEELAAYEDELAELRAEVEAARESASRTGPGRLPVSTLLRIEAGLGPRIEELEAMLRPEAVNPMAVELADPDPAVVADRWERWSVPQRRTALRSFTTSVRVLPVGRIGRRKLAPDESVEILWVGEDV